jgi:hypothetical protein
VIPTMKVWREDTVGVEGGLGNKGQQHRKMYSCLQIRSAKFVRYGNYWLTSDFISKGVEPVDV